jgi:hypothetical protein
MRQQTIADRKSPRLPRAIEPTADLVLKIRALHDEYDLSFALIAVRFAIAASTACKLYYTHLPTDLK